MFLAEHTGQDEERIARDTERDNFMSADEGLEYGLIDKVIERRVDKEDRRKVRTAVNFRLQSRPALV